MPASTTQLVRIKVLITGSEGSLAQMVIPYLLAKGHHVTGVDFGKNSEIRRERSYDFIRADLADTSAVKGLFNGRSYDAVYHFSGLTYGVVGFHKKPADVLAHNNLATINLLEHGRQNIGTFVYLSSSMVYEQCRNYPQKETDTDTAPVMLTSYGLSKYVGERLVRSFHDQYGLKYVIWRPFNIITPIETPEEEGFSHVFSDMVEKILIEKQTPLRVLGDGEQIRCFTNITDVCDAICRYSLDAKAQNQIFNIGQSAHPLTVKQLCGEIARVGTKLGILPATYQLKFLLQPTYEDDVKKRIPDIEKMKTVFGWTAKITPMESIEVYITKKFSADEALNLWARRSAS